MDKVFIVVFAALGAFTYFRTSFEYISTGGTKIYKEEQGFKVKITKV
jgi:hypothetical protein